jgi:hypothetical protein
LPTPLGLNPPTVRRRAEKLGIPTGKYLSSGTLSGIAIVAGARPEPQRFTRPSTKARLGRKWTEVRSIDSTSIKVQRSAAGGKGGASLLAATMLDRPFIGVEMNADYHAITRKRPADPDGLQKVA